LEISSSLREDIEKFLAVGGGSFALLLNMCGGARPPETTWTASPSSGSRSLMQASVEAALDGELA
jgi:hypothetical protein